ncbi:nitrous oxide-stimulated promoter family protein [Halarcobacter sp.]|uniref:nitrous oxide-stimulated promoter family protein n=1 Tax=Halarcobacter sp. TaxID=2321133 RepID=UPI002AAAD525|nr:nitrous oxide-stimulated promoter family protein [Halarcobacter sp.]
MTKEKFNTEIKTLSKFFETYCNCNHNKQFEIKNTIKYKEKNFNINVNLCDECQTLFYYSINKLKNCPHEEKPRCRKCPNPCYDKKEWKALSKVMRSSGLKLGLIKIKKIFL